MAHEQCECKPASRPIFFLEQKKPSAQPAAPPPCIDLRGKKKESWRWEQKSGRRKKDNKTKAKWHTTLDVRRSMCDASSTNLALAYARLDLGPPSSRRKKWHERGIMRTEKTTKQAHTHTTRNKSVWRLFWKHWKQRLFGVRLRNACLRSGSLHSDGVVGVCGRSAAPGRLRRRC